MDLTQYMSTIIGALGGSPALAYGLIFVAVFIGVVGIYQLVAGPTAAERRLVAGSTSAGQIGSTASLRESDSRFGAFLKPLAKFAPGAGEDTRQRQRLIQAGFFRQDAVAIYYGLRVFLAAALPLIFLALSPILVPSASGRGLALMAGLAGVVGIYLPSFVVSRRIAKRRRAVQEGFPDALDMLVVSVEAGLGLDAAFGKVGEQMWKSHPVIAQHFLMVGVELRAGGERAEALRNMSRRIGLDEISSFVTLLIQSEMLGSSISQTLRTYAFEMRQARMLRAEEKAAKLPVLLSIPLVTMILPTMVTAVLTPAIINIIRTLLPALGG